MRALLVALGLLAAVSTASAAEMTLTSPDIAPGGRLALAQAYAGFGCHGANRSPALAWSGIPAGTKSLAVTVFDPDAPTGTGWWHWLVFNLPPTATGLPAEAGIPTSGLLPPGAVQSRSDFGSQGYGGPCPPPGPAHRYVFTLHALKVAKLGFPADTAPSVVGEAIKNSEMTSASLTARFGR